MIPKIQYTKTSADSAYISRTFNEYGDVVILILKKRIDLTHRQFVDQLIEYARIIEEENLFARGLIPHKLRIISAN